MTAWIVTPAGEERPFAPAVVIEADDYQAAAELGLQRLLEEDSGLTRPWGIMCNHCESVAIAEVLVVPVDDRAQTFTVEERLTPTPERAAA